MLKRFLGRVGPVKQLQVLGGDGTRVHQRLEIDYPVPVVLAIDHDANALGQLLGLHQGQQLEQLVEGAKPSRKNDQRLRQVGEPQLAHEEVVELEVQVGRDVRVGHLLEGQMNVEPDGLAARFGSAAIR